MTLFLRDQNNNSIVDMDCWIDSDGDYKFIELSVTVDIMYYSIFLLENLDRKQEIIATFSDIQELRGWLWEVYFNGQKSDPDKYDEVIDVLRKKLKSVAQRFDLDFVVD